MCCFTQEVERVADTSIYARASGDRQVLVYGMSYAAKEALAMVLPIPVAEGAPEDAVRFVNLEGCPDFFGHMRAGFPAEELGAIEHLDLGGLVEAPVRTLEVHEVGSFEASFVPTPADFGRLDERFRLPADLWLQLNAYSDYGFAVFRLKATRYADVHPMAFEFPRRHRDRLFFPTLHIHHRSVEPYAHFDHTLYCQPTPELNFHLAGWEDSLDPAAEFIRCPQGRALVDPEFPCWRLSLLGQFENRDTWVGVADGAPRRSRGD